MPAPAASPHRVLIVDDDDEVRGIMSKLIRTLGYETVEAASITKALKALSSKTVDLMLLDIYLKGATGIDLIKSLHRRRASIPTLVVSGYISEKVARELVRYGVQGIPLVLFFDTDGREVVRHTGMMTQEQIEEQLAKLGVK